MKALTTMWASLVIATFVQGQTPNVVTSCSRLSSLALVNTTITSPQEVPGGKFAELGVYQAPPDSPIGRRISKLPAFCRVAATLAPTPDSDIKIEVWLPVSGWNGKLLAVGNGGWAGSINYNGMTGSVRERVCDGVYRYRPHGRKRIVRDRPSRETHRFRVSRCA